MGVEKILDVHDEDKKAGLTYLIKWKYDDEPTWQPEEDLKSSPGTVKRFHQQNPSKPGPPAWIAPPNGRRQGRLQNQRNARPPGRPRKAREKP